MGKKSKFLQCTHCTRKFFKISQLNRHKEMFHFENCQFICTICDKKYFSQHSLRVHTKVYHENPKSFNCQFTSKDSGIKCQRVYRSLENIRVHLSRVHKINIAYTNVSEWKKLIKETTTGTSQLENDSRSAPEMAKVKQDPDEILNILTSDFDTQVSENTTFEIIDRKFTPDMDFEMGIEKISTNFQNLDHSANGNGFLLTSSNFEIIDRKFTPDMDFEMGIEKISTNFQNLDQNEASDAESESLLDNCDISTRSDTEKIPKVSNLARKSKSRQKVTLKSSSKCPIKRTNECKKSKNEKNTKTRNMPRRSCAKKFDIDSDSDTDFEQESKKVQKLEKKISAKPKPRSKAEKIDKNGPFECKKCNRFYVTARSLLFHNQNTHSKTKNEKDKKYECKECGLKFRYQALLMTHLTRSKAHGKPENIFEMSCPKCPGSSFSRRYNFERHNLTFHEKVKYKCLPCATSFGRMDLLNKHMKTENHLKLIKLNQT